MIVVVMGVVGAGKTTIGRLLAVQLHWEFADADDFHPQANIEKIRHGIPLSNEDRQPWLRQLRQQIERWISQKQNAVLACSALKRSYRDELDISCDVKFVYLQGSEALIAERLRARHGHFADERILSSQFADLEVPKEAVAVPIDYSPEEIVAAVRKKLGL
jgi:gluconokinase